MYEKYWSCLILENKKFTSAHVVIFRDGKVLILRRSKKDPWKPGHYGLPGGKLNSDETPKQALERECQEEANIKINSNNLIFLPKVSANHEHAFYCTDDSSGIIQLNDEHDDFKWIEPKDLKNFKIVPDLNEIIEAAVEAIKGNS